MPIPSNLFEAAALTFLDPPPLHQIDPQVLALLRLLDCPTPTTTGKIEHHRAHLFCIASTFVRVFTLGSRSAPGLYFFGAEVDLDTGAAVQGLPVVGVAGSGLSSLKAFEACIGEGVERLSIVETKDDLAARQPPPSKSPSCLLPLLRDVGEVPHWLALRRLNDGAMIPVPVDLCLRRAPEHRVFVPPQPLTIGCAAGPSAERAMLSGLLELIERDAMALWWRGGQRGRPIAAEEPTMAVVAQQLGQLRQGQMGRRTWLLDITSDIGIPVIAAVSFSLDGDGFCVGTAARPGMAEAATAAVRELAQGELAMEIIEAKRSERGDAGLNTADWNNLRRFGGVHAERCLLVHPVGKPRVTADLPSSSTADLLRTMVDRIAAVGMEVLALDLTRSRFGVPVMRILCPGLECEPSTRNGPRMTAASGGDCQNQGIRLL